MSEETQFWGVAVERYGQGGRPTNALLEFSGITPENKPFPGLPCVLLKGTRRPVCAEAMADAKPGANRANGREYPADKA